MASQQTRETKCPFNQRQLAHFKSCLQDNTQFTETDEDRLEAWFETHMETCQHFSMYEVGLDIERLNLTGSQQEKDAYRQSIDCLLDGIQAKEHQHKDVDENEDEERDAKFLATLTKESLTDFMYFLSNLDPLITRFTCPAPTEGTGAWWRAHDKMCAKYGLLELFKYTSETDWARMDTWSYKVNNLIHDMLEVTQCSSYCGYCKPGDSNEQDAFLAEMLADITFQPVMPQTLKSVGDPQGEMDRDCLLAHGLIEWSDKTEAGPK